MAILTLNWGVQRAVKLCLSVDLVEFSGFRGDDLWWVLKFSRVVQTPEDTMVIVYIVLKGKTYTSKIYYLGQRM